MPRPVDTRTIHRGAQNGPAPAAVLLETLEEKIGYKFRNRELLRRALTHRSALGDRGPQERESSEIGDNEQLEFLGDAILGFIASEALVTRHPGEHEGQLSQWKAHLVSATHLHECALELELGQYLLLGRGEERNGGRERKTLLANGVEAIIAAIYLDARQPDARQLDTGLDRGVQQARLFIQEHVLGVLESPEDVESMGLLNHKSVLQERTQAMGLPVPRYTTVQTNGPEHAKVFTVEVRVGNGLATRAEGTSKKGASQRAAELMLECLNVADSAKNQ